MTMSKEGSFLNSVINNLPIELHAPSYKFLGPGTKNLDNNPINRLDALARDHDLYYSKHKNLQERHQADKILEEKAWKLFKSPTTDTAHKERLWAWITTNVMKAKRKLGMGYPPANVSPNMFLKRRRVRKRNKKGGILPLLPLLGALATAGTIGSNLSNVVKAVGDVKNFFTPKKSGSGLRRKRKASKAKGRGLYLNPPEYRRRNGKGIFLNPPEFYTRHRRKN